MSQTFAFLKQNDLQIGFIRFKQVYFRIKKKKQQRILHIFIKNKLMKLILNLRRLVTTYPNGKKMPLASLKE